MILVFVLISFVLSYQIATIHVGAYNGLCVALDVCINWQDSSLSSTDHSSMFFNETDGEVEGFFYEFSDCDQHVDSLPYIYTNFIDADCQIEAMNTFDVYNDAACEKANLIFQKPSTYRVLAAAGGDDCPAFDNGIWLSRSYNPDCHCADHQCACSDESCGSGRRLF